MGSEPTSAQKIMGKTKRSISRANDPKTLTPAAIYTTNNHINNE